MDRIEDGVVVLMHYTLTNGKGEVIDSSEGSDPLPYLHGAGNIVPGLERQMGGKQPGDRFTAIVPAEEGYGERSGMPPMPVPRGAFPPNLPLFEGAQFLVEGPGGQPMPVWVEAIEGDKVLITQDHPLAGVELHFDITIVSLRAPTEAELEHGHPHGPTGHEGHGH